MKEKIEPSPLPATRQAAQLPLSLWAMVALLYFTQGLPLGLVMDALPALLRRQGASLAMLAWLPLAGLPWVLKFLWAAPVENRWTVRLGRRRSWLLPMQGLVLLVLVGIAWAGMAADTAAVVIGLACVGSLASATQDIATDGLAAERFAGAALARVNAIQVGGTMVGYYTGGAGHLLLAGWFGQRVALGMLVVLVALSLLLLLAWREPAPPEPQSGDRPGPSRLRHFSTRPGSLRLLALTLTCAAISVAGYGLSRLVLVDAQWPMARIGQLGLFGGIATVVLGCGGGAWLIRRWGGRSALAAALGVSALAIALWAVLASRSEIGVPQAALATLLACTGAGLASVTVMTLAMGFSAIGHQPGTDMTAVQSTRDFGEIASPAVMTALAGTLGYSFTLGIALILALVIAIWVWRSERLIALFQPEL